LGHLAGYIPGILAPAGPLGQGQHFAMAAALLHSAGAGCTEEQLNAATQVGVTATGKIRYRCQATDVPEFSTLMSRRNLSQYAEDVSSGNATLIELVMTFCYCAFAAISRIRLRGIASTSAMVLSVAMVKKKFFFGR